MYRLSLIGLCVSLLLAGCNLGGARETEAPLNPTATSGVIPAGKPTVSILSPAANSTVDVGKQMIVNVSASDSVGVSRVQMLVNGAVVKTVQSQSIGGDKTFPAMLDYVPRTAGDLNIQVLAFRGSTASDPATLALKAVSATSGPTPGGSTGGTGSIPVVIPNDGVCRVLTDVNLNMRATPVTGNVLVIIPGGTLAVVTARLGDNSWWKISYNNQQGWVSGQFVDLSGNCSGIPIDAITNPATPTLAPTLTSRPNATNTPVPTTTSVPGRADLLVTQIGGEQRPVLGSSSEVVKQYSVTVTNGGQGGAGPFIVSLKVNDVLDEEWTVSGLAAGQSVLLTTNVTFKTAGTFILRVDADTGGTVAEASDVNNTGFYTVTVSQP